MKIFAAIQELLSLYEEDNAVFDEGLAIATGSEVKDDIDNAREYFIEELRAIAQVEQDKE